MNFIRELINIFTFIHEKCSPFDFWRIFNQNGRLLGNLFSKIKNLWGIWGTLGIGRHKKIWINLDESFRSNFRSCFVLIMFTYLTNYFYFISINIGQTWLFLVDFVSFGTVWFKLIRLVINFGGNFSRILVHFDHSWLFFIMFSQRQMQIRTKKTVFL